MHVHAPPTADRQEIERLVRRLEPARQDGEYNGPELRSHPRRSPAGTVGFSRVTPLGTRRHEAELLNLNEDGLGMRSDVPLQAESILAVTLCVGGRSLEAAAQVRYCHLVRGRYMIGLEFLFAECFC
jgi:hypothetical protein